MTPISDFYEPVRFLAGDDVETPAISDESISAGVRTMIQMGLIPGYALTPTRVAITPDVTNANSWALIAAKVALRLIAAEPESTSNRTRAYSESTRKSVTLQHDLQDMVYRIESGAMFFSGWQSLYSWLIGVSGMTGSDVGYMLTRLNVEVPVAEVTISSGDVITD